MNIWKHASVSTPSREELLDRLVKLGKPPLPTDLAELVARGTGGRMTPPQVVSFFENLCAWINRSDRWPARAELTKDGLSVTLQVDIITAIELPAGPEA